MLLTNVLIYSLTTAENSVNGSNSLSAESVAISLLKKFSEKQLPKASDLIWLVSEKDAPQKVVFLPILQIKSFLSILQIKSLLLFISCKLLLLRCCK